MIKKHPQINHVEETENVKWCVFKVPQYSILSFSFGGEGMGEVI